MENKPLSLELVPMDTTAPEEPAPAAVAPEPESAPSAAELALDESIEIVPLERAIPIVSGAAAIDDPFAMQAAREYAEGRIDKPLWDRALAQANGDKTAAAAIYVRGRAIALRLFSKNKDRRVVAAPAPSPVRARPARPAIDDHDLPRPPGSAFFRYKVAIIATAVAIPLAIGGAFAAFHGTSDSTPELAAAPVAVASAKSAARKPAAAQAAAPEADAPAQVATPAKTGVPPELLRKIQELRDGGNWNLLVLYSVEWTRKDPANYVAWDTLRIGYLQLRQWEDAVNAGKKAVLLAPDEQKLWRFLGLAYLEADDAANALAAFEQAAARNVHDLESLQQVGLLSARLSKPQEAKIAFDRALAASPGDATTTCLRAGVTQMPASPNAYTMWRQVKGIEDRCRGRGDSVVTAGK